MIQNNKTISGIKKHPMKFHNSQDALNCTLSTPLESDLEAFSESCKFETLMGSELVRANIINPPPRLKQKS